MNFITNTLKQNKYNTKLLFADTDNLVYAIKTDHVCDEFYEDKHLFDFSDDQRDSKFF